MDRWRRALALAGVVLLVAVGCSKPKSTEQSIETKQKEGLSALGKDAAGKPNSASEAQVKAVAQQGAAARGYAALNPTADVEHARKVEALIKIMSKDYPNGNPNTWAGVTKDEIKLVFSMDRSNCGVNLINAVSQAGGNLSTGSRYYRADPRDQDTANKQSEEAVMTLVRYWNDHAAQFAGDFTQVTPTLNKFNKPDHLFYGRKITPIIVDGGSFQCPEKTTAAAVKIANEIKPLGVVSNDFPGVNGSGYNMSAALHAKAPASTRPVHFGIIDPSDKYLAQWAPYVWTQFQSGTKAAQMSASLFCSRYVGKKAINAPQMKGKVRKFALLYPNNQSARQVASEFKGSAQKYCGKPLIDAQNEFAYSEDPARAPDEGNQIAVKLKLNDVTTLVYFNDPIGPLFHMVGFKTQGFRPEFAWPGTAYSAVTDVQRLYDQEMVDKASFGYTPFGLEGFSHGAGDAFWIYHAYHQKSPKTGKACDPSSDAGMNHDAEYCKAPGGAGGIGAWYYSWLPLATGMLIAGPDLTPKNISAGLQAYPLTRYGVNGPTDDPQAVLVGAGPGQYYFIVDGSEWKWRSAYVQAPPQKKLGWAEYPDCQRHYMAWPDKLAVQWEKNGPNYNGMCGDAKYAPAPYKPADTPCSDAPSGVCEKDGYPRWFPRR